MKLSGNTIFITGGSSGIGRGLAEALHSRGNQVIIGGRRKGVLAEVAAANPGMAFIEVDVADPASIAAAAAIVIADFPALNVLVNNAGIQQADSPESHIDDKLLVSSVDINLLGPIRMTSALIDHLKGQDDPVIVHVSSMLSMIPLAAVAIYCATKAAMHSYAMSQRYRLRDTAVKVVEIIPTYVQTELNHNAADPYAMPLDTYIAHTMDGLASGSDEVLVPAMQGRREALRPGELAEVTSFNTMLAARSKR